MLFLTHLKTTIFWKSMNEIIFIFHALVICFFSLFALRLGKGALITFIAVQAVLANFLVLKQMDFLGLTITCTDVFMIGSIFSLNLLQEYFGKEEVKKAIGVTFFILLFFIVASQFHVLYVPSAVDNAHAHFQFLFSFMPRIIITSFCVFFLVQYLDMHFFSYLKKKLPFPFMIRAFISLMLSQLVDTVLFSYLALYGIVGSIFDIIIVSFLVKGIIIGLSTPFCLFSKTFYKKEIA